MKKLLVKTLLYSWLVPVLVLAPVAGGGSASAAERPGAAASRTVPAAGEVRIDVDGQKIQLPSAPVIRHGVTLVPMRSVFAALHADVVWEPETKTVIGRKGYTVVTLKVGSKQAIVNGKKMALDAPAEVRGGVTLVPLRFVGEALGADVKWDAKTKTVRIKSAEALAAERKQKLKQEPAKPSAKLTPAEIVERNDESVVMIATNRAQGSGVVISPDLILTNYHVMDGATSGHAVMINDRIYEIAGVIAYDENADLAIIQTKEPLPAQGVKFGSPNSIAKGDTVVAIGSPHGLRNTVSEGLISNIIRENGVTYLQTSAPIDSGSSGGGLFNESGELIGITTSGYQKVNADLNFAVSIEHVHRLLLQIASGEANTAAFLPSKLPSTLKGASESEIVKLLEKEFAYVQTSQGTAEIKDWQAKRDAEGWLVLTANIDPLFYTYYIESSHEELRNWAINLGLTVSGLLPDEAVELIVYYDRTFDFKPRGLNADEVTDLGNGKWKVRYPVIHLQVKEQLHIETRF